MLAEGPIPAHIMIVGEAPDYPSHNAERPFRGAGGALLDKLLAESGINRNDCRITYACRALADPENLFTSKNQATIGSKYINSKYATAPLAEGFTLLCQEIARTKPRIIFALGNVALWALTAHFGLKKWRGSQLHLSGDILESFDSPIFVVPTWSPADINRNWSARPDTIADLRRGVDWLAGRRTEPEYKFHIQPSLEEVQDTCATLVAHNSEVSADIETVGGYIACLGFGWSSTEAICTPFLSAGVNYWPTLEEELCAVQAMRRVLATCPLIGQNFLFDSQFLIRYLGVWPRLIDDTMIMQHACFPGRQKDLGYLSSLYCNFHRFWKEDRKDYRVMPTDDHLFWKYNARDCVITYEVAQSLRNTIRAFKLEDAYTFLMELHEPVLEMMLRGIPINRSLRSTFLVTCSKQQKQIASELTYLIGEQVGQTTSTKPWVTSSTQQQKLFYGEMKLKPVLHKSTRRPTLNDDALDVLWKREPLLYPLNQRLALHRSLGTYRSTFLEAGVDADSHIRCSYNIGGAITYRFSSSQNVFGSGLNLQNIPAEHDGRPDVRKMFVPPEGYTLIEGDLDRADAYVVAWEAGAETLKAVFRAGLDVHTENAKVLFHTTTPTGKQRSFAKAFVHATNYGAPARTVAIATGTTVRESELAQRRWFDAHPAIKQWHIRTKDLVSRSPAVIRHPFGFHFIFFDRPGSAWNEALAWVPQSVVAIAINKALLAIHRTLPEVQILLQVHDSLVMAVETSRLAELMPLIQAAYQIPIPYADPLIIPASFKTSEISWGDMESWQGN